MATDYRVRDQQKQQQDEQQKQTFDIFALYIRYAVKPPVPVFSGVVYFLLCGGATSQFVALDLRGENMQCAATVAFSIHVLYARNICTLRINLLLVCLICSGIHAYCTYGNLQ